MRKSAVTVLLAAAAVGLGAGPAAAQAIRTWVSGVGDDTRPCSRKDPCQTFAGALLKTAPGGEINVIDAGGYGTVTINKSVSINGRGLAGIAYSYTNGIVINAGPNDLVQLRGLIIDGDGSGINGIRYTAGGALHIQDSVIREARSGAAGNNNGILVNPTGGDLALNVLDTVIEDNGSAAAGGAGIAIRPTGAATVRAVLTRVQTQSNRVGISVDGDNGTGAIDVTVTDSVIARNATDGVSALSPNGSDALVRVSIARSTVASNGAIGLHSAGQRVTIRVKDSHVVANGGPGLQANNSGILQSYGDNATEGNGAANIGVTPAPPS